MLRNRRGYFHFIIWIVAAGALLYYGNNWLSNMEHKTNVTHDKNFAIMGRVLYALVLGAMLSFLLGIPGRFKPYKPILLALFVPCFLVFIYGVAVQYIKLPEIPWYGQITRQEGRFFFGLVSGFSLVQGLFEIRK